MKDPHPCSRVFIEILGRIPRLRGALGVVGLAVVLLALVLCFSTDALTKVLAAGVLAAVVVLPLVREKSRGGR